MNVFVREKYPEIAEKEVIGDPEARVVTARISIISQALSSLRLLILFSI